MSNLSQNQAQNQDQAQSPEDVDAKIVEALEAITKYLGALVRQRDKGKSPNLEALHEVVEDLQEVIKKLG